MIRSRSPAVAALAVLLVAACDTKGDNVPLEVSKYQVPKPLVVEQLRIAPEPAVEWRMVRVGDRSWAPTATEYVLPERYLRPVGESDGFEFHALAWDEAPYDRLLVAAPASARPAGGRLGPELDGASVWLEFLEVY